MEYYLSYKKASLMRHLVPLATVNFSQYLNLYSEVYPRYVPYVYWEKDGDRFLDFQNTGGFHLHLLVSSFTYQKSINLQYNTLGCLDDWTNKSSTKRLMFHVLFFFMTSCKILCKNPFNFFLIFS